MRIVTAGYLAARTCGPSLVCLGLAVVLGACGPGGAISPLPTGAPTGGSIAHPSGSSEVVLRLSEAGGLMFAEIRAIDAPVFTLYGDGTFILKSASNPPVIGGAGPVAAQPAWRTGKLSETQIQSLLLAASDVLGPARPRYELNTVMDAPTTTFTISAAGTTKTIEVYALGLEQADNPDARSRAAFKTLADRLRNLVQDGQLATAAYNANRYRGILFESAPVAGPQVRAWPWPDVAPAAFVAPPDPSGLALSRRTMTQVEIGKLGITDVGGGVTGLYLTGPDKKLYAFALRPLLPDEAG